MGGTGTKAFAKEPRYAFGRDQRTHSVSYPQQSSWAWEGVSWGSREHVAVRCPCCDPADVGTRHARICPRPGAQLNQHQLLVHVMPHTLKPLGIRLQVESGEPFTADRNLRMDIAVRRGGLRDSPTRGYREKPILLDVTHADPQTQTHLRGGSADHDGSALPPRRASGNTTLSSGTCNVSFDERSRKLATFCSGELWASRGRGQ